MIDSILYYWENIFPILFTGIVTTGVGVFGYTANKKSVTNNQTDEFMSKQSAQAMLLVFIVIAGVLGSIIQNVIPIIQHKLNPIGELALIFSSSIFILNVMVDEWNHDDDWSKTIYISCILGTIFSYFIFDHGLIESFI